MSFDALKKADVRKKKKTVEIKVGDTAYVFTAHEISYLQRLHLSSIAAAGGDGFTQLIVYSVKDANGQHMTSEQASQLDSQYVEILFMAATEVNQSDPAEDKGEKN